MDGDAVNLGWEPYHIKDAKRDSRWLVICDHASNTVPPWIKSGDLGISKSDMARHIAYDVGAAGLAQSLAHLLGAPAILSNFSRLVIDPNRGEDDPTLVMQLYDGSIIPANRNLSHDDLAERLDRCYRAYHNAVAEMAARRSDTVIVSIHSFTPAFRGRAPRPWHIGLLYADDERLANPLLDLLNAEGDLIVGANQPYSGKLRGDTIDRHAIATGRQNILIEVRNDLIENDEQQAAWAKRCARLLPIALSSAETKEPAYG